MTLSPLVGKSLLLGAALTLAACAGGGGVPTRYYIIGPIQAEPVISRSPPLTVQILGLDLPQYLERVQIATQAGPNQLRFSEANQWGENLRKNLLRTLTRNLSRLLDSPNIGSPAARTAAEPEFRLRVTIEQFERDVEGVVRLDATWQIIDASGVSPVRSFQSQLRTAGTIAAGDYDAIVAAMRSLYGDLSRAIADQLVVPVDPSA